MKLYIIGNGFDLAHELPTSYWDFRSFLKLAPPAFLEAIEEHYDLYPSRAEVKKGIHMELFLKAILLILMRKA